MNTPEFWVAVSFFVLLGVAWWKGGFAAVGAMLDKRGERIASELEEARRLAAEARALRDEYVARRKAAEKEAEEIVASAREEAARVIREAQQRLDDFVATRKAAAEAKIAQAEASAAAEVRAAAADAALRASEVILRDRTRGETADALVREGVSQIRTAFH
ncbi:ATP F0F1 synthase subunit B [Camelimonas abortus]|uniref:ATP synthase subunit b n=1 Tax=Camelimonas abortus TaxID=1017184 RepID=A0ABV7LDP5_9HYPH